jgi:dTDP-D-glucose 4,6-dehydratase
MAAAYARTFGYQIMITRGSNTYGPYQYPEKVVPLFITNARDDIPIPVPLYEDGMNVRDWLYVEDHCAGIDTVLREGTPGEVHNLAADRERSNLELTKRILHLTGKSEKLIKYVTDRPGHGQRYSLDSGKAHALGWQPQMGFEEGLARTVDWYRQHQGLVAQDQGRQLSRVLPADVREPLASVVGRPGVANIVAPEGGHRRVRIALLEPHLRVVGGSRRVIELVHDVTHLLPSAEAR